MAFGDKARKAAEKAAKLGANPAEKMESTWHPGTPYRPVGCFTEPKYPRKIIIPARPLGDDPGDNAKQV